MSNQNVEWISKFFHDAAEDFAKRALGADTRMIPITDSEIEHLREGAESGLVDISGSTLILPGEGKYSLFTLNREYITQVAEYARLIVHEGYDQNDVKFEYRSLDIVVLENGTPIIGIEVKRSQKEGEKLKSSMLGMLPHPEMPSNDRGNDPIRKIKCLLDIRPREFRIVTPTKAWRFYANYPEDGQLLLHKVGESDLS